MEKCISQSQYLFYSDSNVPYRGFVEGIGYVDSMYKDYMIAPPPSATMYPSSPMYGLKGSFYQSIGYIPTVDTSPSKVIRSYGKGAAKKIEDRIVKSNGGNVSVNLGDKILNLSPKNKYRISSDIKNEYCDDAAYTINILYEDEKGSQTITNTYPLDGLPYYISNTEWQDLYTCQPESYSMDLAINTSLNLGKKTDNSAQLQSVPQLQSESSDIRNVLDISANIGGKVSGVGGIVFSGGQEYVGKLFDRDVERFKKIDLENIRKEIRPGVEKNIENTLRNEAKHTLRTEPYKAPNGQSIKFFNKHGSLIKKRSGMYNKAIKNAYDAAHNQAVKDAAIETERIVARRAPEISYKLEKGIDPRVATKFRLLSCLRVINPVLNTVGAAASVYSLVSHVNDIRLGRRENDVLSILKTVKLTVDVAASIVAFIPPYGWAIAGGWFVLSTIGETVYDRYFE